MRSLIFLILKNFIKIFFLATLLGMWDLSSRTRNGPASPAVETWSPNHWITREFPHGGFKQKNHRTKHVPRKTSRLQGWE